MEPPWNPESGRFIVALLWSLVGFAIYFLLSNNKHLALRIWKSNRELDPQVRQVILQRIWGLLVLGVISALWVQLIFKGNLQDYGLGFTFRVHPPWWAYPFIPLILGTGYLVAFTPGNLSRYPQFRIKVWSVPMLVLSGSTWVIFLIGYEFLFRGFLFFSSLEVMVPWAAVALNCVLYAAAHFYKGPGEIMGAIPVGILLCCLTNYTGNIWSAVVIHSIMALSNEWFSIMANPELKVNVYR